MSASNIGIFLDCQYKYKLKYHDRIQEIEPNNIWGAQGSAIHSALKRYFENSPSTSVIDQKKIIELVAEEFSKHGVGLAIYNKWKGLLEDWSNRVSVPKNIIGVEKSIDLVLPNGIPVIMILDLIEETVEGIKIRDWKTGVVPSDEDFENNIQAPMYIIGAKMLYPNKKIEFVFDYIKANVELKYDYTDESMKSFVQFLSGVHKSILETPPESAKPNYGSHCMFCGYHSQCPFMEMARTGKVSVDIVGNVNIDKMIDEERNLNDLMKAVESEEKRIRQIILDKLSNDGLDAFETDSTKITVAQTKYVNYDPKVIMRLFNSTPYITSVLDVKKGEVDKLKNKLSANDVDMIDDTSTTSFSRQYIRITSKRNKNDKKSNRKTGTSEFC